MVYTVYSTIHFVEYDRAFVSRHVDTIRAQIALHDLQVLAHNDNELLVPLHIRYISWEILGICQQISENLQGALYSYQQSLRYPFNRVPNATRQRIRDLH